MSTIDPPTARRRLDEAIRAEPKPSGTHTGKFPQMRTLLAEAMGLSEEDIAPVWVAKPGVLENRVGQGGSAGKKLAAAICTLPDKGSDESPEKYADRREARHASYVKSAQKAVGAGVVGAILICEMRDGHWDAVSVVQPAGAKVADTLRPSFPGTTEITPTREAEGNESASIPPPADEGLADSLFVDSEWVDETIWMLQDKRALVLYGPPGTGKTYIAQKLAAHVQPDATRRSIVQLHPSYAYEDFFEGYRPVVVDGTASLAKRRGPLRELAKLATDHPKQPVVLVLDEMNRGNLPRVFGELFFLLEYRDEAVALMYSPEELFRLPKNLFLICTMNTADRSIALLDQALRRRFHFAALFPDAPPVSGMLRRFLAEHRPEMGWVADVLDETNRLIGDRNAQIGPSHFMRMDLEVTTLRRIWRASILPAIEEHFFGQPARLADFDLDRLIESTGRAANDAGPAA